jgi:asparagine synthase (glutamine-hydrolysing)
MCGICGLISLDGERPISETLVRQMTAVLTHRGPDDEGYLNEPGIGLGFRRLATLDLSPLGNQPMCNEDGSVWVDYNGVIYNFDELIPELKAAGHVFRSRCDTEVILHAYEQWGEACVERFNGMFVFVLWDRRTRTIFIARDRFGVNPLYYWSDGTYFAFSSEPKALLTLPFVPRQLNLPALQTYLLHEYVPAPESIFQGIRKFPSAHRMSFRLDGSALGRRSHDWQPQPFWDLRFQPQDPSPRPVEEYVEEFRELFRSALRYRLKSDVPVGVFLSGGLDSSSIVAMMKQVSPATPRTFSIGYEEKTFNELQYARMVARHFGTEHYEEIIRPDATDLINTVANFLDEPFADASALPTYLVSKLASQHVTVALSGDGGDEFFAGYDWYRADRLASLSIDHLPPHLRERLSSWAQHIPPSAKKKGLRNTTRRFLDVALLPSTLEHARWQTYWHQEDLEQLLSIDASQRLGPGEDLMIRQLLEYFAASGSPHRLDQQQYADAKLYLPDDILFKVDRMSMAVSLETRAPLLDYRVAEFAARLPRQLRLHGMTTKYLMRRAMENILPQAILHRPKLGFNLPYKNWLRTELRGLLQEALSESHLRQQGLFELRYVQTLMREHLSGERDHAHKLWQLLIFQLWDQRYLSGSRMPQASLVESHS